jgi:hypothetical protein
MSSATTDVLSEVNPSPKGAGEAALEPISDAPNLPKELFLETMRLLLALRLKRTLAAFMRASRDCYYLGLPLLLRELNFIPIRNEEHTAAFLEDAMNSDKFSYVRSLCINVHEKVDFDVEVLRRTAPFLVDLMSESERSRKKEQSSGTFYRGCRGWKSCRS